MRRIGRYILNGLTGLSLLLFVATLGLWGRSHWRDDQFQHSGRQWVVNSSNGRIWFLHSSIPYWTGNGYKVFPLNPKYERQWDGLWSIRGIPPQSSRDGWGRIVVVCGFAYATDTQTFARQVRYTRLGVPFWFIAMLTAVAPVLELRRHRSPLPPNACAKCGYDLRATPDRCPECGTIPTKVK